MELPLFERLPVGFALGSNHELAQLRRRKLARRPPLEEPSLEEEAREDVDDKLGWSPGGNPRGW